MSVRVVSLQELPRIEVAGVNWRPIRRTLGVSAFGTNAYSADSGEPVIEAHDELASGHEELYVVASGAARFLIAGEHVEAAAGTLVFIADPAVRREATATQDGTFVIAFGGVPGAAGPVSSWEWRFAADPHAKAGDWATAYEVAARALADHPDDTAVHYDLACYAAQEGRADRAFEHLRRACADPRMAALAASDSDLDRIRQDHRFDTALNQPGEM